jgi:GcrA cell cycle regulator
MGNLGHDNHKLGWLAERIERLKTLWERGWSASAIANDLGGVSRNAVIGKIHRLKGYSPPPHKAPAIAKPPPAPKPKPKPPAPKQPRVVLNVPFLNLTIDELKTGVCRYPHGEAAPYFFCGQPTRDGSPYCALHCRITLQRYQPGAPAAPERRPIA